MAEASYRGVAVTELSRETLEEAYRWAVEELARERRWQLEGLEMERLFAEAQRGRRTVGGGHFC